jgi:hypothetical protein
MSKERNGILTIELTYTDINKAIALLKRINRSDISLSKKIKEDDIELNIVNSEVKSFDVEFDYLNIPKGEERIINGVRCKVFQSSLNYKKELNERINNSL